MSRKLCCTLGMLLCFLVHDVSRAQLAGGTYTINSAVATGGTNYASFTAAITAMSAGVSGPVVFNVVPGSGPYNEQVTIGNITGASATNRIRFNGNGAVVQYNPTATYSGILMMNGAKYVKFDSTTFKSLSATYGYGAILYNACAYDSITRCTFDLGLVTTTTSANSMGIRISTTTSGTSSTASGATNTFLGGNSILGTTGTGGPYYGFYFYGPNTGNVYYNNYVSNYYYYGFYDYYGTNITYLNNTLTRETKTAAAAAAGGYYGLYLYYTAGTSKVVGNRIRNLGGSTANSSYSYPFNIFNATGTAAAPILVSNNAIYNATASPYYGVRLSGCDYLNFYHNTINIEVPVAYTNSNYGLYLTGCTYNTIRNNNIAITGGATSTKYGLYYTGSTNTISDYNNVYVNSTQAGTQYYGYVTAAAATLAAFRTANAPMEANGLSVNPQFTAPATGNLTPLNTALVGAGTNLQATVPTDINGGPRSTNPTIGAFEVLPTIANNASIASALYSPFGNFCAGSQPLKVTVSNAGTNNITSLQVNWTFNGTPQTPVSYTGTLVPITATGASSAVVTLGTATLVAGANNIKVWTSLPNNVADGDPTNDTLTTTLTPTTAFSVTASVDTVCTSASVVLSLSPNSGYAPGALQWQTSPNGTTWTPIANTDSVFYVGSGLAATTYFRAAILNSSAGCVSPSKAIYVSNPMVLTTTPATRCGVGTVTLNATGTTGATLSWYSAASGGAAIGTGTSFVTPALLNTTNFYVSASVGGTQATGKITPVSTTGNTGFSDVGLMFDAYRPFVLTSVDVYPVSTTATPGTVTISLKNAAGTTLQSATANVTSSSTGALNTVPLNFNVPAGTGHRLVVTAASGFASLIRESTASAFTYPYTLAGISSITSSYTGGASSAYYYYLYNWKVTTGCEGTRTAVAATVTPAPAITATTSAATICAGSAATIGVTSSNANYGYIWSSGQNTSSFTATPATTTTYIVNALDATTNCAAIDSVKVTVISPVAAITPSATQTICVGNTTVLTATTSTGVTYQWFKDGALINGATNTTYTVNATGSYTVRVTNTAFGCSTTSAPVVVNVVPPPSAVITPSGAVALCAGDTLALQGPAGTGYTYQWKLGGVNAAAPSTGINYRATTAGTYTLVVTANGCSATSAAAIVTIASLPPTQISPSAPTTVCDSLNLSSSVTGVSYQWNYNGAPIIGGNGPTYTATVTGQYSVTITSLANGCAATSASVVATVNPSPVGTITYASPISFCEGGAVVLNTYDAPNQTYQWTLNGNPIPNATTPNYIVTTSGAYSIVVLNTVTTCGKTAAVVPVTVFGTPVATLVYNPGSNTLSTTRPFASYQWKLNTQTINGATQPNYRPLQSGAYSAIVTDSNGCTAVSDIFFVNSVGVAKTSVGASLKIFPNPTNGLLYVKAAEKVGLIVQDLTGKVVAQADSEQPVDLSHLAEGLYLLHITDKEGRLIGVEKITKIAH